MTLQLKIVTPIGITLEKEMAYVILPASGEEIGTLSEYLSLLTIVQSRQFVARNINS
jgi:F0F1-type ATP synthase epsilon subunit